ncbi:hypothetical protein [Nonomuraea endophytica]|uniref:hypothetical protein n=1 Tax=Nonomuraea endophytica TaxID=714136 RepID=UPI0037C75FD0
MEPMDDAVRVLAQRLKSLRTRRWPEVKITQPMLGEALAKGGRPLSSGLISSWESSTTPKTPPLARLDDYATLFCTPRSIKDGTLRLLPVTELTAEELAERGRIRADLLSLRNDAVHEPAGATANPWDFRDERPITIICGSLPPDLTASLSKYVDPDDPDYMDLYTYADIDALFELHGHLRALNPASTVRRRRVDTVSPTEDFAGHVVLLGGVDFNPRTADVLADPAMPVKQVAEWDAGRVYFEVGEEHYPPTLERGADGREILLEDVAHFYRGPNPLYQSGTLTMCNGMFGRGTLGAVRALTDPALAEANSEYLNTRFAGQESFSLITRVLVMGGAVLTPDWRLSGNVLHEWPEDAG